MSAERTLQLVTNESGPKDGRTDGTLHRVNYSIELKLGDKIAQDDIDGNRFSFEVTPRGDVVINEVKLGPNSQFLLNGLSITPELIQQLVGRVIRPEENSIELRGPTCIHRLGFYMERRY